MTFYLVFGSRHCRIVSVFKDNQETWAAIVIVVVEITEETFNKIDFVHIWVERIVTAASPTNIVWAFNDCYCMMSAW